MTRVHLILVHYRCEAEIRHALASVAADLAGSELVEELTAWVVDNGCTPGADLADPPLPLAPRLLRPGTNLGFGRACNLALEEIDQGVVVFLNPDTKVLPGTLDALLAPLEDPRVGGVGSSLFLDDDLRYTVSEPIDLGPFLPLRAALKARLPVLGLELRELRRRWDYVTARETHPTRMLCGACMAIPHHVLTGVGGFHPGYFMYFEDLDLVRAIRRRGLEIVHAPKARVVHYYDRSARQVGDDKARWINESHALYLARNFSLPSRGLARALAGLTRFLPARERFGDLLQDPGEGRRFSARTPLPHPAPWLFELSENPNFDISATTMVEGESWLVPEPVWEGLVPKTYWTRLSRPDRGGPILHGVMVKES